MELGIRTVPEGRLRQSQAQVPRLLFMFWMVRRFRYTPICCGVTDSNHYLWGNYSTVVTALSTAATAVIPAQRPLAKVLVCLPA